MNITLIQNEAALLTHFDINDATKDLYLGTEYVVFPITKSPLLVSLFFQDTQLTNLKLLSTNSIYGGQTPLEDIDNKFFWLKDARLKLPNRNIMVYAFGNIEPKRGGVNPRLEAFNFTTDEGYVESYTDKLILLDTWGFKIPKTKKLFHSDLGPFVKAFSKQSNQALMIINNHQGYLVGDFVLYAV